MTNFPERLKQLRISRNISQKEIANILEMADRQYRRYENGEVDTPLTIASKIANYFSVSLDFLVGRSNFSHMVMEDDDGNIVVTDSTTPPTTK